MGLVNIKNLNLSQQILELELKIFLQAFINFNNHNIIGWFVWGVFFLFFLFIELMCLIYKFSSDITSFERKKENIDSFERIKFNNLQDFIDDDSKRSLNTYYSSIR